MKDALGVRVVTLWTLPPVVEAAPGERMRQRWMVTRQEVEDQFKVQLEKEVQEVVRPQLGDRRLLVM